MELLLAAAVPNLQGVNMKKVFQLASAINVVLQWRRGARGAQRRAHIGAFFRRRRGRGAANVRLRLCAFARCAFFDVCGWRPLGGGACLPQPRSCGATRCGPPEGAREG